MRLAITEQSSLGILSPSLSICLVPWRRQRRNRAQLDGYAVLRVLRYICFGWIFLLFPLMGLVDFSEILIHLCINLFRTLCSGFLPQIDVGLLTAQSRRRRRRIEVADLRNTYNGLFLYCWGIHQWISLILCFWWSKSWGDYWFKFGILEPVLVMGRDWGRTWRNTGRPGGGPVLESWKSGYPNEFFFIFLVL